MNDNKPADATAEQLLKLVDERLAESRRRREQRAENRRTFRIVAILIIVFGAALAMGVLLFMLEEMRPPREPAAATNVER